MTRRAVIAIVIAVGLFFGAAGAALWAQSGLPRELVTAQGTDEGRRKVLSHDIAVFSGDSLGIRVTGQPDANGRVPGKLVVKIEGQWVDVVTPPAVTPAGR
jgi:hypothetical protein